MKKKVLAWMLSVFMVLTMMPTMAFAETIEGEGIQSGVLAEESKPITVHFSDGYTKEFDSLKSAMRHGYSNGT